MAFESIDEIAREYGLTDSEPDEIRRQLRKLQAQIHPDRNSGDFPSSADKERFLRAEEAIEFLDQYANRNTAVVPLAVVTDLIQTIRSLIPTYQTSNAEIRLAEHVSQRVNAINSQYLFPKITASAVTTVLTTLWAFPSVAAEHPVLKLYVDVSSPFFIVMWLDSAIVTACVWLWAVMVETRQKRFTTRLKTEAFQNELFRNFISSVSLLGEHITKNDFIMYVTRPTSLFNNRILGSFRIFLIDEDLAQSVADVVFARAETKGIIKKNNQQSLSDYYVLVSPDF